MVSLSLLCSKSFLAGSAGGCRRKWSAWPVHSLNVASSSASFSFGVCGPGLGFGDGARLELEAFTE